MRVIHTGGVKISKEKWQEHECVISHARRNLEEFSARLQTCAKRRIGIAIRDIYVGSKGHIGTYEHTRLHIYVRICTYIYIHLYTRPNNDTRGGEKWIHTCIHTHTHTYEKKTYTRHTLHGWPTNLRFYSSSQLFGWLNCYKGTLLRSTVFARYILVHFVYGLWLTRLIRFAMFFLVAWPYPQCSNRRRTETDRCTLRGGGGRRRLSKKRKKGQEKIRFSRFFPSLDSFYRA